MQSNAAAKQSAKYSNSAPTWKMVIKLSLVSSAPAGQPTHATCDGKAGSEVSRAGQGERSAVKSQRRQRRQPATLSQSKGGSILTQAASP